MKVRYIEKIRDDRGNIIKYLLIREDGFELEATSDQIKEELHTGRTEFINLKLDETGRLIDQASSIKEFEIETEYYTVADLIQHKDPKDKKIRFIYDGLAYEGIGEYLCTSVISEYIHNKIIVYSEKLGARVKLAVGMSDNRWRDYSLEIADKFMMKEKTLDFYREHRDEIQFYGSDLEKVDVDPDPQGQYTVLRKAVTGGFNSRTVILIRNNVTGKVYWNFIESAPKSESVYTNVYIKRDKLLLDHIKTVSFDRIKETSDRLEEKIRKVLEAVITNRAFECYDDTYGFLSNFTIVEQAILKRYREDYDFIWGDGKFKHKLHSLLWDIQRKQRDVYFAGIEDEYIFIISKDKQRVLDWYSKQQAENLIADIRSSIITNITTVSRV